MSNDEGHSHVEKDKKKNKIMRHFAYTLIESSSLDWEDHEVANLIVLVANQLDFDQGRLLKCLQQTHCGSPGIMATLSDHGYEFSSKELLSLFFSGAGSISAFISNMGDAMESKVFDLSNDETVNTVSDEIVYLCISVLVVHSLFSCNAANTIVDRPRVWLQ